MSAHTEALICLEDLRRRLAAMVVLPDEMGRSHTVAEYLVNYFRLTEGLIRNHEACVHHGLAEAPATMNDRIGPPDIYIDNDMGWVETNCAKCGHLLGGTARYCSACGSSW